MVSGSVELAGSYENANTLLAYNVTSRTSKITIEDDNIWGTQFLGDCVERSLDAFGFGDVNGEWVKRIGAAFSSTRSDCDLVVLLEEGVCDRVTNVGASADDESDALRGRHSEQYL